MSNENGPKFQVGEVVTVVKSPLKFIEDCFRALGFPKNNPLVGAIMFVAGDVVRIQHKAVGHNFKVLEINELGLVKLNTPEEHTWFAPECLKLAKTQEE